MFSKLKRVREKTYQIMDVKSVPCMLMWLSIYLKILLGQGLSGKLPDMLCHLQPLLSNRIFINKYC